jgi:hypothetical protein
VETALLLPLILILLMGAIDFGRLFFSWVSLHQAARIAANHASIDPSTTADDIPGLISNELAVMSCAPGAPSLVYTTGGLPTTSPALGDYAEVTLTCDFSLITPLSDMFFGDPVALGAVAAFPVRTGCLDCSGGPAGPPPPPPPEQCRTVPELIEMSVAGARLAWESAGFIPANFSPTAGQDTSTVDGFDINTTDVTCTSPLAIFNASVTVVAAIAESEPAGCEVVPNVVGMTITEARAAWAATAFTGEVLPPGPDADPLAVVTGQDLTQDGSPVVADGGVSCLDPTADPPYDIELDAGSPWPDPPAVPCQVPHMIDKKRNAAQSGWVTAGFLPAKFNPGNGNFNVKWQSLVGLSWQPCDAVITVAASAP